MMWTRFFILLLMAETNYVVLAEAAAQPLPSWAGVAAVGIQTILLGPVLYWIGWKRLPEEDRIRQALLKSAEGERERERQSRSADRETDRLSRHTMANEFTRAVAELYEAHKEDLKDARREFRESLKEILTHCKEETTRVIEAVKHELTLMRMRDDEEGGRGGGNQQPGP